MMNYRLIYGLTSIMLLFFISCDSDDTVTSGSIDNEINIKTNLPPTRVTLESISDTVCMTGTITLTCQAEDPENDPFTYEWASFKLTENSTVENYEFDYWHNRGRFISTGKEAIWKPAKLEGKYLILCDVKDKAGYELTATKILQVIVADCPLSMRTENVKYDLSDLYPGTWLEVVAIIQNYLEHTVTVPQCGAPTTGVEKKVDNQWTTFSNMAICACRGYECTRIFLELNPGQTIKCFSWPLDFSPGQYRLFIPYNIGSVHDSYADTLYSSVFEVVE